MKPTYVDLSHQESGVSSYWRRLSGTGNRLVSPSLRKPEQLTLPWGVGVQEHARGLCTPASVLEARSGLGSLALCLAVSGGLHVGTGSSPAVQSLQRQGLGSPEEKDLNTAGDRHTSRESSRHVAVPGPPRSHGHTEKDASSGGSTPLSGGPGPSLAGPP